MLKSIIIGCGRIAGAPRTATPTSTHAGAYKANAEVALVACVDRTKVKSQDFAARFGCESFSSVSLALQQHQPDIVSVCTPNSTHYSVVKEILMSPNLPRVIFLEKPACSSITELAELQILSLNKQVEIVVNHSRRFDARYSKIRERIKQNEFGDMLRADVVYYNGWQNNGVHIVDTMAYLFDSELEVLKLKGVILTPVCQDPTLEFEMAFKNKYGRIMLSGIDERYYQLFDFSFQFTNARLRIEDFGSKIILEKKVVNEIGENVLKQVKHGIVQSSDTPMQIAVNLICTRLISGNKSLLKGFLLSDIAQTMKTIWDGIAIYENQYQSA
jgi:predicted dehydrogenase